MPPVQKDHGAVLSHMVMPVQTNPPAMLKCSTYDCVQRIVLDNKYVNWSMYLLHCAFYHHFRVYVCVKASHKTVSIGPSGVVPGEGTVSQEIDGGSMHVTALETCQWDRMWRWKIVTVTSLTPCGLTLMCVLVLQFLTKCLKSESNKIIEQKKTYKERECFHATVQCVSVLS